jgi:hypothetical protein
MGFGGSLTKAGRARRVKLAVVATLALALGAAPLRAQEAGQPDSPFRALMKATGLATDPDPPPDFVLQSRGPQPPTPIPPFTKPPEPPGKVKTDKELEAMDKDLESVDKRDNALRSRFPPAAKALRDAAAAKKDKSKPKTAADEPLQ